MNRMGHSVNTVNHNIPHRLAYVGRDTVSLLYDREGNRKYLTTAERNAFLNASKGMSKDVRLFNSVLAYTGARISEVLALTPHQIDVGARLMVFETLKKRKIGMFRAVPIPVELMNE